MTNKFIEQQQPVLSTKFGTEKQHTKF